jgi:hypothetical protein
MRAPMMRASLLPWALLAAVGCVHVVDVLEASPSLRSDDPLEADASTAQAVGATEDHHRVGPADALLADGEVRIPLDWKTLPQAAALWTSTEPYPYASVAAAGSLLTLEQDELVAHDGHTGEVRWRAGLVDGDVVGTRLGAGCGVAVSFEATAVTARDLSSGAVLWSRRFPRPRDRFGGGARVSGCIGAIELTRDRRRLAGFHDGAVVRAFDVRDGHTLLEHRCERTCELVEVRATEIVVEDDAGARVRAPLDGVGPSALEAGGCPFDGEQPAHGVDTASHGSVCIRVENGRVERVRPREAARDDRPAEGEGEPLWTVRISDPVVDAWRWRVLALSASHLLVRALPPSGSVGYPVVVDVDPETGAVRSVQLLPVEGDVVLDGDLAYVGRHNRTVAFDLSREAPPIRERESLADDVERSVRQLLSRDYRGRSELTSEYPSEAGQAADWLTRLLPLVGEELRGRLHRATAEEAASLVSVVGRDARPEAQRAVAATLERSYGAPTTERARLRAAAAAALASPMEREVATRLGAETVGWLEHLHESGLLAVLASGDCRSEQREPECDEAHAIWVAIEAGRRALVLGAEDTAPLERLRRTIADIARPAPVTCVPTEDDDAQNAVLRAMVELWPTVERVAAPAGSCVDVVSLAGRVTAEEGMPLGAWVVWPAPGVLRTEPGETGATRRVFGWQFRTGCSHGIAIVVVERVDGVWRVRDDGRER